MPDDDNKRTVILITKGPYKSPLSGREWVVYRNRYPEEYGGFVRSILGIGDEYNKLETFDSREEAIEYGLEIAEPDEKVQAQHERSGAQEVIRKPITANGRP